MESELWSMESKHMIEINELQATKHKDLGTMMFWQIKRRFKKVNNKIYLLIYVGIKLFTRKNRI